MTSNKDNESTIISESTKKQFLGRTIVVTGTLVNFTRHTINSKIESLGGKAGRAVSKNTDYLICGDKPGSKLVRACVLGVPILSERQFVRMAESA